MQYVKSSLSKFFFATAIVAAINFTTVLGQHVEAQYLSPLLLLTMFEEYKANEVLPSIQAAADLELPDGRNITIHREAQTGQKRKGAIYFHRPIFAFIKNPDNKLEHPIFWDKIEYDNNIFISLHLLLSTLEFRELCSAAVIEEDPSLQIEKPEIKESDINVRPWPLKILKLEAKHALTGRKFGESLEESLRTTGNKVEVSIKIPSKNYPDFMKALNNERLKFSPSYTFENLIVASGSSATQITGEVSLAVNNIMNSHRLMEDKPIFQRDKSKLENIL